MQKFNLVALAALLGALGAGSIQTAAAAEDEAAAYKPLTLAAEAGTLGLGASLSWRFADHFGVRGGFNYFSREQDGNEIEGVSYNTDLRLMSEPLGFDFYPSARSSFRITIGALINQNQLDGVMPQLAPGQTITLGDLGNTYDQAIGDLNLEVTQQTISPYLAIGASFYLDKAQRWAIGGELGVAYTGSPEASLTHSSGVVSAALTQDEAAEAQQIEDELEKYKFYPIVKLSVSFSF